MTHKHHIIPKYLGGTDDPENLIELSPSHHLLVHWWYYRMWGRQEDLGACYLLCGWKSELGRMGAKRINDRRESDPAFRERLFRIRSKASRERISKINWNKNCQEANKKLQERRANDKEFDKKCREASRKNAHAIHDFMKRNPEVEESWHRNIRGAVKLREERRRNDPNFAAKLKEASARGGRTMANKLNSQRWEDPDHPELGLLPPGPLVRKQRALGLPSEKENRRRVS
jgi:hypothetical protein